MKIDVNRIPPEGLILEEDFDPGKLELETEIVRFRGPVKAIARVSKIVNAVTVHLELRAFLQEICSRCIKDFDVDFRKEIELNYPIDKLESVIELDPDIREEIILDYPLKPLCASACKGLCPKCGKNLNEGGCTCGPT